jgi:hypothetical protein
MGSAIKIQMLAAGANLCLQARTRRTTAGEDDWVTHTHGAALAAISIGIITTNVSNTPAPAELRRRPCLHLTA